MFEYSKVDNINNTLCYTDRVSNTRLDRIVSLCLGFLLIVGSPVAGSFASYLIPLIGSYRLKLFEASLIPVVYVGLIVYGFRIKKYEQFLFVSIILVIFSRIISLLTAQEIMMEQWISILRYVGTLVVIYILANLLSNSATRHFFIWGLIIGLAIDMAGSIFIFLFIGGRGIFIGVSVLRIFLIVVCMFVFANRRHQFVMSVLIVIIFLGILALLSRSALIVLVTVLVATAVYLRKDFFRVFIPIAILIVLSFLAIGFVFPSSVEYFWQRTISGFNYRGGTIAYRLYLWDKSVGAFLMRPVTGIGSGGFARQMRHLPQIFQFQLPEYYSAEPRRTHNLILGIASETGIVGLAAYAFWVFAVMNISLRVLRLRHMHSSDDIYAIAASLLIITLILNDAWSENSFTVTSNALVGFVLGWLRTISNKRKSHI